MKKKNSYFGFSSTSSLQCGITYNTVNLSASGTLIRGHFHSTMSYLPLSCTLSQYHVLSPLSCIGTLSLGYRVVPEDGFTIFAEDRNSKIDI